MPARWYCYIVATKERLAARWYCYLVATNERLDRTYSAMWAQSRARRAAYERYCPRDWNPYVTTDGRLATLCGGRRAPLLCAGVIAVLRNNTTKRLERQYCCPGTMARLTARLRRYNVLLDGVIAVIAPSLRAPRAARAYCLLITAYGRLGPTILLQVDRCAIGK